MSSPSLKRNALYNAAAAIVPLAVALLTTPYLLNTLGNARFGIIALVWLLFNYFGIFDLGLSQATSNRLSKTENGALPRQAEIVWTALAVNTGFGVIGGCIFYFSAGIVFSRMDSIPKEIIGELPASILWMACLVPISTVNAVFAGVLESRERFGELNSWQVLGSIAGQVGPLLAIYLIAPRLDVALGATACTRLLFMMPVALSALAQIRWHRVWPTSAALKDLLSYGWWITATNLVSPLLVSADQFLIGSILGVAAVPHYSIPFTLASKVLIIPGALVRALFPRLSRATLAEATAQAIAAMGLIAWGLALVCVPGMFLIETILRLWLGEQFSEQATAVSRILLLGIWMNGVSQIPHLLLQSQGRPDLPAKLHWIEVIPFIAILWVCIHSFGLVGAAIAWTLRVAFDCGSLMWAAGFRGAAFRRFVVPFVAVAAALAIVFVIGVGALASIGLAILAFIALAWLAFREESEVRRLVHSLVLRFRPA